MGWHSYVYWANVDIVHHFQAIEPLLRYCDSTVFTRATLC